MTLLVNVALEIVNREAGHVSTHYADCYLYHLACFAQLVLDSEGQS